MLDGIEVTIQGVSGELGFNASNAGRRRKPLPI